MQVYESLPTFTEAKELLLAKVEDAKVSYEPQIIEPYTLECMCKSYTPEEYGEIETLIAPFKEGVKQRPNMLLVGFEHVHLPSIEFPLPSRATDSSAGYDFYLPNDIVVGPDSPVLVKLGVKAHLESYQVLQLYIRSSLSKKIFLLNSIGIIDADYYNNPDNMGEIGVMLQAWPGQGPVELNRGDRVVQGLIMQYHTIDIDVPRNPERTGGYGSTGIH